MYKFNDSSFLLTHFDLTLNNSLYFFFSPVLSNRNNNYVNSSQSSLKIKNLFYDDSFLSGVGYKNSWVYFQIGRDSESWGAGRNIQIALSSSSNSYDYIMFGSDYGRIRVKYIHALLEEINQENRYLNARGIEWTNKKSFLIGLSEIIIYSGKNRPLDIAYLNPLLSHLEVDLNNRASFLNGNAVWQISTDLMIKNKIRLSFNLLYDEFILDKVQKEEGKENGKAFSLKFVYNLDDFFYSNNFNVFFSMVHIGTPTFRHLNGTNNFVQKGNPLGWHLGSDGDDISFGSYYEKKVFSFESKIGVRRVGDESILFRPYDSYKDYIKGSYPSGEFKSIIYSYTNFQYHFKKAGSVFISTDYTKTNMRTKLNSFSLGLMINLTNINW